MPHQPGRGRPASVAVAAAAAAGHGDGRRPHKTGHESVPKTGRPSQAISRAQSELIFK
jgi:hypothetical protein